MIIIRSTLSSLDPLNTLESSHLSTSDYQSFDTSHPLDCSSLAIVKNKMFDITDLLGSSSFDDREHWFDHLQPISSSSPSLNVGDYLRTQALKSHIDSHEKSQWQIEENRLKYGETLFFY